MRMGMGLQLSQILRGLAAAGSPLLVDLQSYWALNETTGTRYDAVGDRDLTPSGTMGMLAYGPTGTVAKFTAADADYLEAASPIIVPTASFSVAGWCYRATQVDGGIVNVDNTSNRPFNIDLIGNSMRAYPNGGYIAYGPAAPPIGDWFFFCGSVNREELALGRVHMWVNGAEGATRDMDGAINATTGTVFRIGTRKAWNDSNSSFRMARVGVWSKALSLAEQTSLMNGGLGKSYAELSAADKVGLTAYWDLSEASGNRADSHSTYTLSDNNTVGSETAAHLIKSSGALKFVSGNPHLAGAVYNTNLGVDGAITVAAWLNADQTGTQYQAPVAQWGDSTTDKSFILYLTYADVSFSVRKADDSAEVPATLSVGATAGTWALFVGWYDPVADKVYLQKNNGTPAEAANTGGIKSGTAANFYIGRGWQLGINFAGQVDEVGIWSRVLTADERTELYNAGAGKFYPFE